MYRLMRLTKKKNENETEKGKERERETEKGKTRYNDKVWEEPNNQ